MKRQPYILHALSPLHAGTGQGVDIVDLPIARMKATGIPVVPGSGVKGALRHVVETSGEPDAAKVARAVFGPSLDAGDNPSDHAGAVAIGDARLLALPVRSLRGVFAWVTSPLLLTLAARDLRTEDGAVVPDIPTVTGRAARISSMTKSAVELSNHIFLEDLDLKFVEEKVVEAWATHISERVFFASGEEASFKARFVVVDDETMAFLWETATQVDARNRISHETGTVVDGALWYEESLPPETLLIGVVGAESSRFAEHAMGSDDVIDAAMLHDEVVQFGGKATVGRGLCRVLRPAAIARQGGEG